MLAKKLVACLIISSVQLISFVNLTEGVVNSQPLISINFPEPPPEEENYDNGGTVGAGSRGDDCNGMAIIPQDREIATTSWNNPTIFWYIPDSKEDKDNFIVSAEIILRSPLGEELLRTPVDLPEQASIVQFKLPRNLISEKNQTYWFQLKVICEPGYTESERVFLKMVDITPEQTKQIEQANNPLEKAQLYAQFNIWTETLATMIELKEDQPQQWQELLTSVGIKQEDIDKIGEATLITIE